MQTWHAVNLKFCCLFRRYTGLESRPSSWISTPYKPRHKQKVLPLPQKLAVWLKEVLIAQ